MQSPAELSRAGNRRTLDLIQQLNREHLAARDEDDELSARVLAAYELAFRMQAAAPELVELNTESADTLRMYGVDRTCDERVRYTLPASTTHDRTRSALCPSVFWRYEWLGRAQRCTKEPYDDVAERRICPLLDCYAI